VLNKAVVDESKEHKAIILKCETIKQIPIGSEIFDKSGEELAVTGQGGRALVRVKDTAGRLKVQWGVKSTEICESEYAVDGNAKANSNGLIPLRLQCR
jgi:outer membrane usher protein FimD/PapC